MGVIPGHGDIPPAKEPDNSNSSDPKPKVDIKAPELSSIFEGIIKTVRNSIKDLNDESMAVDVELNFSTVQISENGTDLLFWSKSQQNNSALSVKLATRIRPEQLT